MAGRRGPKTPSQRPGKEGGKRALNRQKRVDDLVSAGLVLFLDKGVASVTIDEIASRAGTAKGNFYRYFDDKRALVDAILDKPAAEVRRAMRRCAVSLARANDEEGLSAAYTDLANALALVAMKHLPVMRLYLQENRAPATSETAGLHALADELEDGAVRLTEVAVEHGLLRVSDPRVSALAVVGAVEQLAIAIFRGRLDVPPADVATMVVSMVLEGIRQR
ncbi:MAG: TetR/AcrR family transcriptional regulator [Myxococcota bacterium]